MRLRSVHRYVKPREEWEIPGTIEEFGYSALAAFTGIPIEKLKSGESLTVEESKRVSAAADVLEELNLEVSEDDKPQRWSIRAWTMPLSTGSKRRC